MTPGCGEGVKMSNTLFATCAVVVSLLLSMTLAQAQYGSDDLDRELQRIDQQYEQDRINRELRNQQDQIDQLDWDRRQEKYR
jgi:LPS O-antigen subunit length determinant protein (WzzB/FepE family)